MHPLLFSLGPIPIHSYGFLIALGFLLSLMVLKRLSIRSGIDPEKMVDLGFWCLLSGFLGARILFVITRWSFFKNDLVAIFRVWEGGLVFYGGVILAFCVAVFYVRLRRIDPWKAADIAMPGLALAHVFGRLGCLSAGCCYGKPTGTSFGVSFYSELVDPRYHGINLHPTQLYEAAALLVLFIGLIFVFKSKVFDGQVGLTYFAVYPLIRSVVEIYRGDQIRGFIIEDVLSTSQFISIFVFLGAVGVLVYRLRQVERKKA